MIIWDDHVDSIGSDRIPKLIVNRRLKGKVTLSRLLDE
jgi:hypothetical protein